MCQSTKLWYEQPAEKFTEALPLGNGRMGAMFYGGVMRERLSLNEDTLWSGYPRISQKHCAQTYAQIQKLVLEDRRAEAEALTEASFGDFLVQQYLPLGDLTLEFSHTGKIADYSRSLALDQAVGTVSYTAGDCRYQRQYVISPGYQVLAVNLTCDRPGKVSFALSLDGKLQCSRTQGENTLYLWGNCPIALAEPGDCYTDVEHHHYSSKEEEKGVAYRCGVTVRTENGTLRRENGKLLVENADSATVFFAVRTSFNGACKHPVLEAKPNWDTCDRDLQKALDAGYAAVLADTVAQHQELFARTELTLCDGQSSALPTDRRIEKHNAGAEDPSLYALLFNLGKYLTIAGSRKGTRAMNLQGIWNEEILPPWSSNYTVNINTEMNYWPTLTLGLFECYEPLVELVEGLHANGRITARNFYGKNGFVSHHATDLWCLTHPSSNLRKDSTQWSFWNMSSGWLTRMLFDYYRYTGDQDYLRRIFPIVSDCARFYREMLTEQDGELILCPSTSPENNYLENGKKIAIDRTTAMTMQIIYDVFSCQLRACEVLGEDGSEYARLLSRLKTDFVDADGNLREWYGPRQQWEPTHRHLSHLYGLFPSDQFGPREKEAARHVLRERGDDGTGWSLAWKINLWARLGDGEKAKQLLDRQLMLVDGSGAGGSYPNLFCAHPPFQIDGNFGACSGILQMLLQTDEAGEPICLPALPESWRSGAVKGFCLPGGKKISFRWENGKRILE